MGLTPKQEEFIRAYLRDPNATKAAIRAKYSRKTANEQGARLLAKASIREAIATGRAKQAQKSGVKIQNVIKEYAGIGFSNISDYLSFGQEGVTLKDSSTISREMLAAVSEVSEVRTKDGCTVKFKLHPKTAALDALCRMLGFNHADRETPTTKLPAFEIRILSPEESKPPEATAADVAEI